MRGILLDENGDVMVSNGSVVIGDVDGQIAEHVIAAFQGEFKESPLLGGNALKMLNGVPDPFWAGDIKRQLKSQGISAEVGVGDGGDLVVELIKN